MSIITRVCHRCKTERPIAEFYVKAEARNTARRSRGMRYPCRPCQQAGLLELRAPRQVIVDEYKTRSGCMDCGLHPEYLAVLEFDHRPNEVKSFNISSRMYSGKIEDLIAEIEKCDIVCANCHRIRTTKRKQYGQTYGRERISKAQVYKDRAAGLGHVWDADVIPEANGIPGQLDLFAVPEVA